MDALADFSDATVAEGYLSRRPKSDWVTTVKRWLPIGMDCRTLADLGCGSGAYGLALKNALKFERLLLVDSSPAVVNRLRESDPDAGTEVIQARADDWEPDGPGVDLLLMKSLIHHLTDWSATVTRLFKYISFDGCIAIQTRTREQAALFTDLEFFLLSFPKVHEAVASRYPTFASISALANQLRAEFVAVSYVDQWTVSVEGHLSRLSRRRGHSLLWQFTDEQLTEIVKLTMARYDTERLSNESLTFRLPTSLFFLIKRRGNGG